MSCVEETGTSKEDAMLIILIVLIVVGVVIFVVFVVVRRRFTKPPPQFTTIDTSLSYRAKWDLMLKSKPFV